LVGRTAWGGVGQQDIWIFLVFLNPEKSTSLKIEKPYLEGLQNYESFKEIEGIKMNTLPFWIDLKIIVDLELKILETTNLENWFEFLGSLNIS
jgi:hypothetical protein